MQGIARLYDALLRNPEFQFLHPSFDTLADFQSFLRDWGNISEDMPSEQIFVYRIYRDKVISFLLGERHLRSARNPLELFAIWYLIGPTNAFYEGSPVDLDSEAKKNLPVGDRKSATALTIRLLEELRQERSIDYLFFELDAQEIERPNSYGRCLFRVYARAEEEVQQHFAFDPVLSKSQFFVIDFPFLVPFWNEAEQSAILRHHMLVCCPLKPGLRDVFRAGKIPQALVVTLLTSIYEMFWDYFDSDALRRQGIQAATAEAIERFRAHSATTGGMTPCYALRDYVAKHFRGTMHASSGRNRD